MLFFNCQFGLIRKYLCAGYFEQIEPSNIACLTPLTVYPKCDGVVHDRKQAIVSGARVHGTVVRGGDVHHDARSEEKIHKKIGLKSRLQILYL